MGRRKKCSKLSDGSTKRCEAKNLRASSPSLVPERIEKICKSSPNSARLLDVYGRLELPLLRLDENNLLTDSDDEETLEFEIRPRFVYACSMCPICAESSEARFTCEDCKMISYCGLEHLEANRGAHRGLCDAMCREFGGIEAFRFAREATAESYRSARIKLIEGTEKRIQRVLELWEREIILYPRVCRACRRIGEDLIRCRCCDMDYYCSNHSGDHAKWCQEFRLFRRVLSMQHKHGYSSPNFPDVARKKCHPIAENFDALLLDVFGNNANYRRIDAHTYASMSLSATAPLTALFALQKTRDDWTTRETLRIDVVGAEFQFECSSLRVWEKLFLHFLPKLRKLRLDFTGPELRLPAAPLELLSRVALCRRCNNEKRRIVVNFNEGKLYHEVPVAAPSDGPGADLVCLFNPGLYRDTGYDGGDTWPKTIERFCRAKVPVLVTSYTEVEIPRDIERIRSIAKIETLLEPQKNPFASVKPDRNFVSDDVVPLMYKNYCLSVVRGL